MSNEEKILKMLEDLSEGQKKTNERLDSMDGRLDSMESKIEVLQSDVKSLKKDTRDIKLDLKGVWQDILRLDERTEETRRMVR